MSSSNNYKESLAFFSSSRTSSFKTRLNSQSIASKTAFSASLAESFAFAATCVMRSDFVIFQRFRDAIEIFRVCDDPKCSEFIGLSNEIEMCTVGMDHFC